MWRGDAGAADVALAYLKGKDAECAQTICLNTGVHGFVTRKFYAVQNAGPRPD